MGPDTTSMEQPNPRRCCSSVAGVLDLCLLVALVVGALSWLLDPLSLEECGVDFRISWGWKPITAPLLLIGLRLACVRFAARSAQAGCGFWPRTWYRRAVLMVMMPFLILFSMETLLAVTGFEAHLPTIITKDEQGRQVHERTRGIVPDKELLHRFNPGGSFRGRPINRLGFLDREIDPAKSPGTVRVICMGDSCSAQGVPPYSGTLHRLLGEQPPDDRSWEAFNMAVHGYSSSQGLRLYQRRVPALHPDYVTLYFGWNDHWQAWAPDSHRMAVSTSPVQQYFLSRLSRKRLFQVPLHLADPFRTPRIRKGELCLRVPHEEYALNMHRFAVAIRADGCRPVFVTAPRGETLTPILEHKNNVRSIAEGLQLHDDYVAITRQAAREENAHLIDLAALMDPTANPEFFTNDGIHFTQDGLAEIGRIFHQHFQRFARESGPSPSRPPEPSAATGT